jgi:flavin reductase (DIM6/NTAB) family NADH-FMN oxidoreductase RutF
VLVCVDDYSRFHDAITAVQTWSVNVLEESQRGRASWFASRGRPLTGQFDSTPTHRSDLTGALLLDGSLAVVECRTVAIHRAGDHDIVIGEVLDLRIEAPDANPLVYYAREFRTLT